MPSLPLPSTDCLNEWPRVLVAPMFTGRVVRCLLVGAVALLLVSCTGQRSGPSPADGGTVADSSTEKEQFPPRIYECFDADGAAFEIRVQSAGDSLTVILPGRFGDRERILASVPSASGAKYRGGGVTFWSKATEATVEVGGQAFRGCVEASPSVWREARRRGVQFRAVGQEPGWLVEVYDDRLRFAWAYGQREVTVPRAGAGGTSESGRTVYRGTTDRGPLRIVAEENRCTDVMSGEVFSHTVTVTFDGQTYAGCGRTLR